MYKVNLLPASYIKNKRDQQIKNRVIYGLIILLVVIFFAHRLIIRLEHKQAEQLDALSQANANLTNIIQRFNNPDSPIADATQIDSIIGRFEESGTDYVRILIQIGNCTPDDVLISSLSMPGASDEKACIISASALRYESISDWISALSEIDGLGSITFSYLSSGEVMPIENLSSETFEEIVSDRISFEFRISLN